MKKDTRWWSVVVLCFFVCSSIEELLYANPEGMNALECSSVENNCSLSQALAQAMNGDTILLTPGRFVEETLYITDLSITISSLNNDTEHTKLTSSGDDSIFIISNSIIEFSFLTFENCSNSCVIVQSNSPTSFENCSFFNNGLTASYGGAIRSSSFIVITDSSFIGNVIYTQNAISSAGSDTAMIYGGAVYSSSANVSRTIFMNNGIFKNGDNSHLTYAYGGAMEIMQNSVIEDCIFRNNFIKGGFFYYTSGGAVRSNEIISTSNIFDGNYLETFGEGGGSTETANSRFSTGGAISAPTSAIVFNSTFTNNTAYSSGYSSYGGSFGGAIDGGYISVELSTFINNLVKTQIFNELWMNSNFGTASGGAIYSATSDINSSIFSQNIALALSEDIELNIQTSAIAGALTGTTSVTCLNSTFTDNFVYAESLYEQAYAGAIQSWHTVISDSYFYNNTAASGGAFGGYLHNNDDLLIENCSFERNIATDTSSNLVGGGAVFVYGSNINNIINITHSIFYDNQAFTGPDIYLHDVSYALEYTEYSDNGIYIDDCYALVNISSSPSNSIIPSIESSNSITPSISVSSIPSVSPSISPALESQSISSSSSFNTLNSLTNSTTNVAASNFTSSILEWIFILVAAFLIIILVSFILIIVFIIYKKRTSKIDFQALDDIELEMDELE